MAIDPYEVYALRYAHHERPARDNFMFGDDIHDGPQALEFYVWVIRGNGRTFLVDLGFDHAGAERRGRSVIRLPSEALGMLNIQPESIEDVIVTHLHYDHAGDLNAFPNANLYLQERELAFATGKHMALSTVRMAFDVEYVCDFVRAVYDERVTFVNGSKEIAPGVSLHHIGGHTDGHQAVRVWTEAGWLVLASDAIHLYANRDLPNPFPIVHTVTAMVAGYGRLDELASHRDLIIPGHDPLVLSRFPCPQREFAGELVRLDQGPIRT